MRVVDFTTACSNQIKGDLEGILRFYVDLLFSKTIILFQYNLLAPNGVNLNNFF